jgi:hypothetical protein
MTLLHVKWFHDFSFLDSPLGFGDALTPLVVWMMLGGAIAIGSMVFVDGALSGSRIYSQITNWLEARKEHGPLVMRVGAGMTLLLSWQSDAILVPELAASAAWIGWLQFALTILLIFPRMTPVAGGGIAILWLIGLTDVGLFHMLDYVLFLGVAIYLVVSSSPVQWLKGIGIPALYVGLGFSLMWVALEKIVYPAWGTNILELNQSLTLGIPTDQFLIFVAVSELVLGFLLVIGLMGRPLGIAITLVLFSTAVTFGKTEVVGHTIIHAALIVFLLEGEGSFYKTPIDVHRKLSLRFAFASLNFVIVSAVMFAVYVAWSKLVFENAAV